MCMKEEIKKRATRREQPIFVNLKSNTMKNTLQMYSTFFYIPNIITKYSL